MSAFENKRNVRFHKLVAVGPRGIAQTCLDGKHNAAQSVSIRLYPAATKLNLKKRARPSRSAPCSFQSECRLSVRYRLCKYCRMTSPPPGSPPVCTVQGFSFPCDRRHVLILGKSLQFSYDALRTSTRVRPRFRLLPTGVSTEAGDKWDNKRVWYLAFHLGSRKPPALSGASIGCPMGPFSRPAYA